MELRGRLVRSLSPQTDSLPSTDCFHDVSASDMSTDDKKESTTPILEVLEEDDEFEVRPRCLALQDEPHDLSTPDIHIDHQRVSHLAGLVSHCPPCQSSTKKTERRPPVTR